MLQSVLAVCCYQLHFKSLKISLEILVSVLGLSSGGTIELFWETVQLVDQGVDIFNQWIWQSHTQHSEKEKKKEKLLRKNTLLSCERYFFLKLGLLAFKRAASAQGGDRSRPNCMLATRACRREESVIRGRGLLKFPLGMDIINIWWENRWNRYSLIFSTKSMHWMNFQKVLPTPGSTYLKSSLLFPPV